jgi:hypothetical protein
MGDFNPAHVPQAKTAHLGVIRTLRGALEAAGEPFHASVGIALIFTFERAVAAVEESFKFSRFFQGPCKGQRNPPGSCQFIEISLNLVQGFQSELGRFNEIGIVGELHQPLSRDPLQDHRSGHVG